MRSAASSPAALPTRLAAAHFEAWESPEYSASQAPRLVVFSATASSATCPLVNGEVTHLDSACPRWRVTAATGCSVRMAVGSTETGPSMARSAVLLVLVTISRRTQLATTRSPASVLQQLERQVERCADLLQQIGVDVGLHQQVGEGQRVEVRHRRASLERIGCK